LEGEYPSALLVLRSLSGVVVMGPIRSGLHQQCANFSLLLTLEGTSHHFTQLNNSTDLWFRWPAGTVVDVIDTGSAQSQGTISWVPDRTKL
jgi:hypothetical protein